ncbi:hypothetical protein E7Y32_13490 [Arthrobacter sp. UKPF54-2]|uniref:hypothetical protein n=1 Tax=Arthrobacter sp. UKPF54-2 TaxID=2600159 RepID=UPI0011B19C0E|nr:hypothetical protein [Arthrobacter sp. UKPF54-2]QDY91107.1 hypothetical protein E7Y32_13490 [Arthrobacter sp. UKPF54-2]
MPWWTWIVIWIALISLSLLFYGVLGVRLFRQFMATVKELGEAGDRFSNFASAPLTSGSAAVHVDPVGSNGDGEGTGSGLRAAPGSAVFAPPASMRHDYHASKVARQKARRLRRIRRKAERGQPQALRDINLR